jgi:hypothetical protein
MRIRENKNRTTVYCYRVEWNAEAKRSKDIAIGKVKDVGDRTVFPHLTREITAELTNEEIKELNQYFEDRRTEAIKELDLQCVKDLSKNLTRARVAILDHDYRPTEQEAERLVDAMVSMERVLEDLGYARDLVLKAKEERHNRALWRKPVEED